MAAPTDSVEIPAIPTAVVTAAGTDIFPVSQGGVTKRETNAQQLTWIEGAIALNANKITAGQLALARGGTGADLSATGGANQVVRQNSAGGVLTVSALAAGDLPNTAVTPGSYGAAATVGTFTVDQQGRLTLATDVPIAISAAAVTSGTLAVARGGTGLASYAVGDILFADGAASLAKLADVATGNVLISGGVTTAPAWGQVGLTTHVTGILPSANGGTGVNNAGSLTLATSAAITGGGTLALGGFTLTVPATGSAALLATANVFTLAQTAQRDSIGASTTDGLILTNATAAAAGVQQWSPRLRLTGQGWKTNATAASQTVDWIVENLPVQGAANPTTQLVMSSQVNGTGYVEQLRVGAGTMLLPATSNISFGGSVLLQIVSNFLRLQAVSGIGLSFWTGNVERSRWLATGNGNLGVGHLTPATQLHVATTDAVTGAVTNVFTVGHNSSGSPITAGFGVGVLTQLESTTTEDTTVADVVTKWLVPTHASRTTQRESAVYDTARRVTITEESSGSAPMIGFLGAAAAIRQTGGAQTATGTWTATEQDMLQKVYDMARTFGFLT